VNLLCIQLYAGSLGGNAMIAPAYQGKFVLKETIPFSVQCSCGISNTTRIIKTELKKENAFVTDCRACGNALVVTITGQDLESSTISYSVQVRASDPRK